MGKLARQISYSTFPVLTEVAAMRQDGPVWCAHHTGPSTVLCNLTTAIQYGTYKKDTLLTLIALHMESVFPISARYLPAVGKVTVTALFCNATRFFLSN